jgi:hypothetical protein
MLLSPEEYSQLVLQMRREKSPALVGKQKQQSQLAQCLFFPSLLGTMSINPTTRREDVSQAKTSKIPPNFPY